MTIIEKRGLDRAALLRRCAARCRPAAAGREDRAMTRILIVEDVELNRDLLVQLLEDDHEVLTAADGGAGLERPARAARPDPDGPVAAGDRRLGGDPPAEGRPGAAASR